MKIKKRINYIYKVIFIASIFSNSLLAENNAVDSIFYKKYFSFTIEKRCAFIKTNISSLQRRNITTIDTDLKNLFGFDLVTKRYFIFNHNVPFLNDSTLFIYVMDSLRENISNIFKYKSNEDLKTLSSQMKIDSAERYFKSYLLCDLKSRISFCEKYYKKLDVFYLEIVQDDLDNLIEIETKKIVVNLKINKKRLDLAIKNWRKYFYKKAKN